MTKNEFEERAAKQLAKFLVDNKYVRIELDYSIREQVMIYSAAVVVRNPNDSKDERAFFYEEAEPLIRAETTNWFRNPDGPEAADEIELLRGLLREASIYVPVNDLDPLTLPDRIRGALEPPPVNTSNGGSDDEV